MSICDKPKPKRPAAKPPAPVVTPCPTCLIVRIVDVAGLYQPGVDDRTVKVADATRASGYFKTYKSSDNKGRIFIDSVPGSPPFLDNAVWTKDKQFVDITVVIDPPTIAIPPGSKVTWSFSDPDDPTNEGPDVHPDAGIILDPKDYTAGKPPTKTGANANDNDPSGVKQESAHFEQISATYALSGNTTLIDIPNRTSKVRFNVSDVAGDNWIVKASIVPVAPITTTTPDSTGIMTAWNRVQVEYVKMKGLGKTELPLGQLATHYDMACVQIDVWEKHEVADKTSFGSNDADARAAVERFATKRGAFTHAGEKGWFFIAAAMRFLPQATAEILYEGTATANGKTIRIPPGTASFPKKADVVRVFDPSKIVGASAALSDDPARYITFLVQSRTNNDLQLILHDFHEVADPDNDSVDADLTSYGFAAGTPITIQVLSKGEGGVVFRGISPGSKKSGAVTFFAGRVVVFMQSLAGPGGGAGSDIRLLVHELCHAFNNAHRCGNWDWKNVSPRTSCAMNYWIHGILDDSSPRKIIPWMQNRMSAELCAKHLRHIRDFHQESNPILGWG